MPTQQDKSSFHILLLGDFSGRANCGLRDPDSGLIALRPLKVDRDNLNRLIDRLEVQLTGTIVARDNEPVTIRFHELEDFGPDRLFENVALFASLRSLRERLLNETTFSAAAEEVLSWGELTGATSSSESVHAASQPERNVAEQDATQLLDGMLENSQSRDATSIAIDWNRLIQGIIAPVMPRRLNVRQDELVACVDAATQSLMTALLHHPHFQNLEATWRGLDFLVRRVETDASLKIFLVDVTKTELVKDLMSGQKLASTGLYRLLVEQALQTPGAVPWSLLCGLYSFGDSIEDVELLAQLARIADAAQAPFLSAADGSLVGCHNADTMPEPDDWKQMNVDFKSHWEELCRSAEAARVALLWPRFLLRVPYGAKTNPIDAFSFEEMPQTVRHEHLLWGNPVILAACAIGQSFAEMGRDTNMAQARELSDLPLFTEQRDGETILHLCGELLLTQRAAEHLRQRGITPVLSIQARDAIRISTVQSIRGGVLGEN